MNKHAPICPQETLAPLFSLPPDSCCVRTGVPVSAPRRKPLPTRSFSVETLPLLPGRPGCPPACKHASARRGHMRHVRIRTQVRCCFVEARERGQLPRCSGLQTRGCRGRGSRLPGGSGGRPRLSQRRRSTRAPCRSKRWLPWNHTVWGGRFGEFRFAVTNTEVSLLPFLMTTQIHY